MKKILLVSSLLIISLTSYASVTSIVKEDTKQEETIRHKAYNRVSPLQAKIIALIEQSCTLKGESIEEALKTVQFDTITQETIKQQIEIRNKLILENMNWMISTRPINETEKRHFNNRILFSLQLHSLDDTTTLCKKIRAYTRKKNAPMPPKKINQFLQESHIMPFAFILHKIQIKLDHLQRQLTHPEVQKKASEVSEYLKNPGSPAAIILRNACIQVVEHPENADCSQSIKSSMLDILKSIQFPFITPDALITQEEAERLNLNKIIEIINNIQYLDLSYWQ